MLFNRTHSYATALSAEALKNRLLGAHVKIHNVDFEIIEGDDNAILILPHAEQIEEVKTLPDTVVKFGTVNGQTRVTLTSNIREFDQGAPLLIMIANGLIYTAAAILFFVFHFQLPTYIVLGVGLLVTILFAARMQSGYFDYVKKVHAYVKSKSQTEHEAYTGVGALSS